MFHKNKFFFLFLIFSFSTCFGQIETPARLKKFTAKFVSLISENKFDSISIHLSNFENINDLNQYEHQTLYFFKGYFYGQIDKPNESLNAFKKSISYSFKDPKSEKTKCLSLYHITNLYFTEKKYDKAYEFALKAKPYLKKDYYNEYIGVYSIIGYYHFNNFNYRTSLSNYKIAEKIILEKKDSCKLPEVQSKIARLFSKTGKFDDAIKMINFCIAKAKNCNNPESEQHYRNTKLDILKENHKLQEALKESDTLNKINQQIDRNNRFEKIDAIETKYKTKLKEAQNKQLEISIKEKQKTLNNQKNALIGAIIGILSLCFLLYFIYKLNRKQKQTNKELERLNLLNQKIFSVISHDFKGPITTLKMMLSSTNNSQNIASYLNDIKNQLDQSDAMLDSLLDWAKAELLIDSSIVEKINIQDFVTENIAEFDLKLNEKNIQIMNNIPNSICIDFNKSVLKIVFRNLINNAIKFSYENNKIDINWRNDSIEVLDYGKGIDDKKLDRLFKQNINPSLGTKLETGFGIGLYLSNELMQKNKGTLSAKNNPEKGSSFLISFTN